MNVYKNFGLSVMLVAAALVVAGCASEKPAADSAGTSSSVNVTVDDHSGWWCKEHGIPEEECSMCSASFSKECKEKGDWCEEHNRAESQCFKCDPTRAEKYAKLYEAKYGEKPPEIAD